MIVILKFWFLKAQSHHFGKSAMQNHILHVLGMSGKFNPIVFPSGCMCVCGVSNICKFDIFVLKFHIYTIFLFLQIIVISEIYELLITCFYLLLWEIVFGITIQFRYHFKCDQSSPKAKTYGIQHEVGRNDASSFHNRCSLKKGPNFHLLEGSWPNKTEK